MSTHFCVCACWYKSRQLSSTKIKNPSGEVDTSHDNFAPPHFSLNICIHTPEESMTHGHAEKSDSYMWHQMRIHPSENKLAIRLKNQNLHTASPNTTIGFVSNNRELMMKINFRSKLLWRYHLYCFLQRFQKYLQDFSRQRFPSYIMLWDV